MQTLPLQKILREEEERRAQYEAQKYGLQYLDLRRLSPNPEVIGIIKKDDVYRYHFIVISKINDILNIITPEPLNPAKEKFLEDLKNKGWRIRLFYVSKSSFKKAFEHYKYFTPPPSPLKNVIFIKSSELENLRYKIKTIQDLKNTIKTIPSDKLLKVIIGIAVSLEASDIHFDPKPNSVSLRLRIDTILQEIMDIKKSLYETLLSRLKILSDLKINIRNISQDGRFTIKIMSDEDELLLREIDTRVSIIPGGNGEIAIIRLLGIGIKRLDLQELGLLSHHLQKLKFYLQKPNGLILTTGPTGSGKTTTLYSAIKFINRPEINIITIENPIEYKLEGINQSQIDPDSGYDFPTALRAILRQDPDVILVGEIRDPETAKTAVQAALTGHLVLSTTHTNDAPSTIQRLKELGLDEKQLTSSVNLIMAQRLVRRLCNYCKEKYYPDRSTIESIKMVLSLISPKAKIEIPQDIKYLYRAKGCKNCFGMGYKGLIGIFEVMEITESLEKMILEGETSIFKLRAKAMEEGMITLLQDAILKTVWGITDLDEVRRVAGDFKYIESIYGHTVASILTKSLSITPEIFEAVKKLENFEQINTFLNKIPYEKILEGIFGIAVNLRATDVHIEPEEKDILIRLRIDGVLEDIAHLPKEEFMPLLAEIKMISGITKEIAGKSLDGRFKISLFEKIYNIRVSIIPGGYGETFVLRILRPDIEKVPLEKLGIREEQFVIIQRLLKQTKGMILATGPTSSGKTTTLFAMISKLNKPDVKIITIEDPIEYTIEGLVQTQINEDDGYTFYEALRHILRQNPNIILVGEIRDPETAKTAVQAALTGHLLLSTLHTIDSFSSIERLQTLNITREEVSDALIALIAQRLVRRLCNKCKKEVEPTNEELILIKNILSNLHQEDLKNKYLKSNIKIFKPQGCKSCGPTGYLGQIGVFEIFEVTPKYKKMIFEGTPVFEIRDSAIKDGTILMQHDAILKVLEGITTIEEFKRVFGENPEIQRTLKNKKA